MNTSDLYYSRLPRDILTFLKDYYSYDKRRTFHNWEHVERVYTWCNKLELSYDLSLDLAIAFHDVIYDENKDKELRSIDMMKDIIRNYEISNLEQENIDKAEFLIKTTISHTPCEDNRLILCDLGDISVQFFREINFKKIIRESVALYGKERDTTLLANINFIKGIRNNLEDNIENWPSDERPVFFSILAGISEHIKLAQQELLKL